jgi:alpha-glucosidase
LYDKFQPKEPYYFVAMLDTNVPTTVAVKGAALPGISGGSDSANAAQLEAAAVNAFYYNQSLRTTFVKVFDTSAQTQVVGTFPS